MDNPPGILSIKPTARGVTHFVVDARIDVRPIFVVLTEFAHEVRDLPTAAIITRLAYAAPPRGTELT